MVLAGYRCIPWPARLPTVAETPANPVVSVNSTGLKPRVYSGSIIFNWHDGTQNLPNTFTVGQATTPIVSAAPATIAFFFFNDPTPPNTHSFPIPNPFRS